MKGGRKISIMLGGLLRRVLLHGGIVEVRNLLPDHNLKRRLTSEDKIIHPEQKEVLYNKVSASMQVDIMALVPVSSVWLQAGWRSLVEDLHPQIVSHWLLEQSEQRESSVFFSQGRLSMIF